MVHAKTANGHDKLLPHLRLGLWKSKQRRYTRTWEITGHLEGNLGQPPSKYTTHLAGRYNKAGPGGGGVFRAEGNMNLQILA